jgi:hypothetical protein
MEFIREDVNKGFLPSRSMKSPLYGIDIFIHITLYLFISQTEDRYIVIGNAAGRVLFVNEVEIDEDTIRIVSARRAQRNEVEAYNEYCSLFFGKRT